ncbi:MAG: hypothetical protein ACK5IP_22285 [Paracoccus sp. (in: a-proteobacteria)]
MTIDMAALCAFEDVTGKNGFSMLQLLQNGGIKAGLIMARDLRALIYGGLKSHHPDMTLDLAGMILDSNAEAFSAALRSAAPQPGDIPEDEPSSGKTVRPRARRTKK